MQKNSLLKRLISLEVRKRRRWRSRGGIFAVVSGYGIHEVDNIGLGGVSFHYTEGGLPKGRGAFGLSLRSHKVPSGAVKLKARTVADEEVGELVFQNKKIKRCSICFEPLSSNQKRVLKEIIKKNCSDAI